MASPSFEVGRPSVQALATSNLIERLLKGSRAIDAEALCIVGGQKVWAIRVDVRALDVEVTGETVKAFTAEERVSVPLNIHHLPVPVSFALFPPDSKHAEPLWLVDPNRLEE